MMQYKIFTEHKNVDTIIEMAKALFSTFTLYSVDGVWRGRCEKTLVIEIMIGDCLINAKPGSDAMMVSDSVRNIQHTLGDAYVEQFCKDIKAMNEQESVVVQVMECMGTYL
jgi:hypothetical protein